MLNIEIASDTVSLEYSCGRRNVWCSGEMLRYHEELRLRRQLTGLLTDTEARKCGYQTGLDTLVVHAVNDDNSLPAI